MEKLLDQGIKGFVEMGIQAVKDIPLENLAVAVIGLIVLKKNS